jgi:hypothetical protein
LDDTLTSGTAADIASKTSTFTSVLIPVTLTGSNEQDRVGVFFKQRPIKSGTYKIRYTAFASDLRSDEAFIDLNYDGSNYVSSDTLQGISVEVVDNNINVQFQDIVYTFNKKVVSGGSTERIGGKFSGNLNFQ